MDTVFTLSKAFHEEDSLTHRTYPFTLKKDYKRLVISFNYLPKAYDDEADSLRLIKECYNRGGVDISDAAARAELPLNNLITISIDSPLKPSGCAHRHLNHAEYFISQAEASRGFLPTKITKGTWKIVLSIHCILSDKVDVDVRVDCYD